MSRKSLGVLTLDVVARTGGFVQGMDQAERSSAKWRKQVEKDLKTIGKVSGAAIGAAAAATAALVVQQVRAATEISNMAQLAGAGTTEFQRYAVAADVVGISQEKLSDQLKDFNEKVGEFQQSGAGGMKDFFEQIAPQIGITADAFRNLSGPQALQLYYDSLEKAGLSQQQMSFYLESMASDTTALIPLLRDGGAGFKLLGDEAERAGAIMSEDVISSAERLSAAMFVAENAMKGFRNDVSERLLPVLGDLAVEFSNVADEGAIADDVGNVLSGTIKGLAATAVGAFAALQLLGRGIAGIALVGGELTDTEWYEKIIPPLLARRIYKNWDDAKQALDVVGADLDETALRYGEMINNIWNAGEAQGGAEGGGSTIDRIARLRKEMRELSAEITGGGGTTISEEAKKAEDAIAKEITALERAAKTWGMTADEIKLYTLEEQGASDAQQLQAANAIRVVKSLNAQAEAYKRVREEQKRIDEQVGGVLDFLKTEEERLADSYEERRRIIVESSILAEEEKAAAVLALNDKLNTDMMAMEQARQSAMLTSYGTLFDSIGGLAAQFAGEQSGIARAMFAVSKAFAIADAIVKIQQGIASAAALPFPANIPAMASVAAATTGIVSTIQGTQMVGMAHDGIDSVPQTGTWLLEKGERVTTAETSAKLDRKLDMIHPGGGGGGITIHAPVTVEGQPGMTAGEAQQQGDAVSGALRATIISTLEKESRPGGMLWGMYGGGH